jgi:hypothetical protein
MVSNPLHGDGCGDIDVSLRRLCFIKDQRCISQSTVLSSSFVRGWQANGNPSSAHCRRIDSEDR